MFGQAYLRQMEKRLHESEIDIDDDTLDEELRDIFFQCHLFLYDLSYDFAAYLELGPTGLAQKVALKNMMLKIYEFNIAWENKIIQKIKSIGTRKGSGDLTDGIDQINQIYKASRKVVSTWKQVRDKLGGHYDPDYKLQRRLLNSVDLDAITSVQQDYMRLCIDVLNLLKQSATASQA